MKKITITDIVPLSVLYNIAKRVRTAAASIAKSKDVPRTDGNTIGIPVGKVTQNQAEVNLTLSEVSAAYEWGSGKYRKSSARGAPAKYPIVAKNYPTLQFHGTNGYPEKNPGGIIRIESVMHPGVAARPFLKPAKEQTRQENLKELRENATKNIKLIVVGMSRKV